jgi:hypothetical protein
MAVFITTYSFMILMMLLDDFLYFEARVKCQIDLLRQPWILFAELVKNAGDFVVLLLDVCDCLVIHY